MVVIFHRGRRTPDSEVVGHAPEYAVRGVEFCLRMGDIVLADRQTGESVEVEQCEGAFLIGNWYYRDVDTIEDANWSHATAGKERPTITFNEFEALATSTDTQP